MKLLLFLMLYFFCTNSTNIPTTITNININSYLGHWYLVYQAPTNIIFQGYGTCLTADYGILDNGNISVVNTQTDKNNEVEKINGYGYYKNISEPGKLTVHLEGVPVDSPYWIIKLGEIKNDEYQYTIITTPSFISLWVLVRDIASFFEMYNKEVIKFLDKYNFKYRSVSQKNCNYTN